MLFKKISTSEAITRIAALGLLAGVILSWPLWSDIARQSFPLMPLFGSADTRNDAVWGGFIQPYFTIALILCAGIFFKKKWLPALLTAWMFWLCCLDLNRLQPWVWFYVLIFAAVVFGKKGNEASTVNTLRWLLAGVYFWSGFNKLTPYFAEGNFAWFCEAFDFTKSCGQYPALGYTLALVEMSFAAGLLWEKTRSAFRWMIVGFHAVIVIFLLKLNWNWVVIPWNLAMAGMVWALTPTPDHSLEVLGEGPGVTRSGMLGLVWITPALCFLYLWPHALSWQLYSNTQPEATFYIENEQVTLFCESEYSENHTKKMWQKLAFDDGTKLLLDDWATSELRVPMFSSRRTFRQIGKYLCGCTSNPDSAGIYMLTVNPWNKTAEKMEKIPCRVLLTK